MTDTFPLPWNALYIARLYSWGQPELKQALVHNTTQQKLKWDRIMHQKVNKIKLLCKVYALYIPCYNILRHFMRLYWNFSDNRRPENTCCVVQKKFVTTPECILTQCQASLLAMPYWAWSIMINPYCNFFSAVLHCASVRR